MSSGLMITCQICGNQFPAKTRLAKYCSGRCRTAAWRGVKVERHASFEDLPPEVYGQFLTIWRASFMTGRLLQQMCERHGVEAAQLAIEIVQVAIADQQKASK